MNVWKQYSIILKLNIKQGICLNALEFNRYVSLIITLPNLLC